MTTPDKIPQDSIKIQNGAYYGAPLIRPQDNIPCIFGNSLGVDLSFGLMTPGQIFRGAGNVDLANNSGFVGGWTGFQDQLSNTGIVGGWNAQDQLNNTGIVGANNFSVWGMQDMYASTTLLPFSTGESYTGFIYGSAASSYTLNNNDNGNNPTTSSTGNNNLEVNGYKATINADGTITYKDPDGKTVPAYKAPETLVANANAEANKRKPS